MDYDVNQGAGKALCPFVLTVFPENSSSEVLPVTWADANVSSSCVVLVDVAACVI